MKKIRSFIKGLAVFAAAAMIASTLCACGGESAETGEPETKTATKTATETATETAAADETSDGEMQTSENNTEDKDMSKINIIVGGKTFTAQLYDNETAREFAGMLPLTVNMSELNSNEKYYYMPYYLPTDPSRPGTIRTGDLMLYGSDCIVLFYKDFRTSYSYTPLGRIDDPTGLADALGSGSVQVTFQF